MTNKAVLLSGASGIIGRAASEALEKEGFEVFAVTRAHAQLRPSPSGPHIIEADLLSPQGLATVRAELPEVVYGFVHLARSRGNLGGPDSSRQQWLDEIELATFLPFTLGRWLAKSRQTERIILSGSIYGVGAQLPELYDSEEKLNPHYGAARAASIQIARDLAVQLAPNTQVNSVSWGGVHEGTSDRVQEAYGKRSPSKRMLSVEEAVSPILYLLSPQASGVTGHNLMVDGGWTAV